MRNTKIVVLLLLCSMMIISCLSIQIFAAGNETNLVYNLSATEVNVGDTVTLTIGLKETKASSVIMGVSFDKELLTVTKRSANDLVWSGFDENDEEEVEDRTLGCNTLTSTKNANNTGYLGVVYVNVNTDVTYSAKSDVLTITFTAKAAGTVNFTFREDSDGPDGFKSDNAATTTLTIKEAHTCTHDHYVTENNKHQSVCACGENIGEAANCEISKETKKCTECGEDCSHIDFANSSVRYTDNGDGTHIYKVFCNDCNDWGIKDAAQTCVDSDSNGYCDLCHVHSGWTDNGNGTCSQVCACGLNNGPRDHAFFMGNCSRCGATEHTCSENLTHHEAVASTCTVAGNREYWSCSCGKFYSDANATTEIVENSWVLGLDADNHKNTYVADGFHLDSGDSAYHYQWLACSDCTNKTIEQVNREKHNDENGDGNHDCDKCGYQNVTVHTGGTPTCTEQATCTECGEKYGETNDDHAATGKLIITPIGVTQTVKYVVEWDYECSACHQKIVGGTWYSNQVVVTPGNCQNEGVNTYNFNPLSGREGYENYVYQDNGLDWLTFDANTKAMVITIKTEKNENNHASDEVTYDNKTATTHDVHYACCGALKEAGVKHTYKGDEHKCDCGAKFTGWEGKTYFVEAVMQTGWTKIDDAWYYLDTETGYRAEGLTRVPYPAAPINGVTYARNEEDVAYYNAHKDTSKYSDLETAVFYFDANGKFVQYDGIVGNSYFIDGMAPWHVGMVKIGNDYYYFAGDKSDAKMGNVMATGKVYASRDFNSGKANGVYNFATDGTLLGNYFGLFEQGGKIYYRRSNGELAKGKYYITTTNGMKGFAEGMKLYFDETTGEMLGIKNGIVEEGGVLYYYENNHLACSKGIVKMTDEQGETYYIYVRSNGQLATGKYWPTTGVITEENPDGLLPRGEYDWGTDGKYYPAK